MLNLKTHNYFTNYHTSTCFDTIASFSGELVIIIWPSYTSISNAAVGNTIPTVIQYIPRQNESNMNIQTIYMVTKQTDFKRTVATKWS
jgi:hypothetical protein